MTKLFTHKIPVVSKILHILFFLLIWPSTAIFACSLISYPVDRFKSDRFVYSAEIVNIYTDNNIFVNPEVNAESPEYRAGGLMLDPIQVWNSPDSLNLHAVFLVELMPDYSYAFASFELLSSSHSVGDTVAVVARYMDSELWGDSTSDYPILMVIPSAAGSLSNTKYLSSDLGIDKDVLSFTEHLNSLSSEMRENTEAYQRRLREQHERLRNINRRERDRIRESERENNIKEREEYELRHSILRSAFRATQMRKNFELQRNLSKIHNSKLEDEVMHYLSIISHNWYSRWGNNSDYIRIKFDCGYTSLITHYLSYRSMIDELFEVFKNNSGRTLPTLNECISEYNLPFTK